MIIKGVFFLFALTLTLNIKIDNKIVEIIANDNSLHSQTKYGRHFMKNKNADINDNMLSGFADFINDIIYANDI